MIKGALREFPCLDKKISVLSCFSFVTNIRSVLFLTGANIAQIFGPAISNISLSSTILLKSTI